MRRGSALLWIFTPPQIWVAEEGAAAGDSRFQFLQRDDGIGNYLTKDIQGLQIKNILVINHYYILVNLVVSKK